jgi:hypothetical protein
MLRTRPREARDDESAAAIRREHSDVPLRWGTGDLHGVLGSDLGQIILALA